MQSARPSGVLSASMPEADVEQLSIDTIRTLSMDAVQQANAGHPGTAMALAPLGYLLYTEVMRHAPADQRWPRLRAPVLRAPPHRLRAPARRAEALPPVGLDDPRAPRARAHAGDRDH